MANLVAALAHLLHDPSHDVNQEIEKCRIVLVCQKKKDEAIKKIWISVKT
ncbi:MAG TPA: hypothetical protein VEI57_00920 [Nitrospirota bacterium]|nr:hypothetical protein [Nitrospirota bacterium]